MIPEIKERWVKELRSGNWPQGRQTLNNDDGYCCLGVLCEIALQDDVVSKGKIDNIAYYGKHGTGSSYLLPTQVQIWGSVDENPVFYIKRSDLPVSLQDDDFGPTDMNGNLRVSLAGMNDAGASFDEIADVIEKYL